ncbi:guanylate kinase [Megalodesulfovibrio paquesii]
MASTTRPGLALVISAPSGAGKTTLVKRLTAEFPRFSYSISCTTRAPREGEVDGKDYHFLTREEFLTRRDQGYFAEWAEVHGNFYGTPLAGVCRQLQEGRDLLFDIDVQGALQLRPWLKAFHLFILPPDLATLRQRLEQRGKDTPEIIERRMQNAAEEIRRAPLFDCQLVNDDLETAWQELRALYLYLDLQARNSPDFARIILEGGRL